MNETPRLWVPCAECGKPMVKRLNTFNGSEFLGCANYPTCTHTEKLPEYLRLVASGASQLPGLEAL